MLQGSGTVSGSKRKQTNARRVATIVESRKEPMIERSPTPYRSEVASHRESAQATEETFGATPTSKNRLHNTPRSRQGSSQESRSPANKEVDVSRSPVSNTNVSTLSRTRDTPQNKDDPSVSQSGSTSSLHPPPTTPKKRPKRAAARQAESKLVHQQ